MNKKKLSVCGCALTDYLYTRIDFNSPAVQSLLTKTNGDGGLAIGKLVFMEDLMEYSGLAREVVLEKIAGNQSYDFRNVGGPAIVGAVGASQILHGKDVQVDFYGYYGTDDCGDFLIETARTSEVDLSHYRKVDGPSPCTYVFSDPNWHDGKGERSFVNQLGVADTEDSSFPGDDFFAGDVLWFSATALLPHVHDRLGEFLKRGRAGGKINVVSTVFDFRNEKKAPNAPWPLGNPDSWKDMDLLIMDKDEALRISGKETLEDALTFFVNSGVSSFFITCGAKSFSAWSDGRLFQASNGVLTLPVSALADQDLAEHPELRGDTTGCGDNFACGIVASLYLQMESGIQPGGFSLKEAAAWGAASGGGALFQKGGMYHEKVRGERQKMLSRYAEAYLTQPGV